MPLRRRGPKSIRPASAGSIPRNRPVSQGSSSSSPSLVWFGALLLYRLANAYSVSTYLVPDETWQSLEVAHRVVFGTGYLTWEWHHQLRSYAYPFYVSTLYRLVQWVLPVDDPFQLGPAKSDSPNATAAFLAVDGTAWAVYLPPIVLGATTAAIIDWYTYKFSRRYLGPLVADWTLVASLLSYPMGTLMVRPLGNAAETAAVAVALYHWPLYVAVRAETAANFPWRAYVRSLAWAALGCILRPTGALVWSCAAVPLLWRWLVYQGPRRFFTELLPGLLAATVTIGAAAVGAMMLIDYAFYGTWVFTPYNFFQFNVQRNLTGTITALAVVAGYSLLEHKEARFLTCLLPIWLTLSGAGLFAFFSPQTTAATTKSAFGTIRSALHHPFGSRRQLLLAALIIGSLGAIGYTNLVHQRGVVDVVNYLRGDVRRQSTQPRVHHILFLMPCHSTPYYSHLHYDVTLSYLACDPPLEPEQIKAGDHYQYPSGEFGRDPAAFLVDYLARLQPASPTEPAASTNHTASGAGDLFALPRDTALHFSPLPSHIVIFSVDLPALAPIFTLNGYLEDRRFFNTHWNGDSRRRGDVVLLRRT
ncbi:glycosylphosphatidylinositol anchor biosynthesis [Tieghemiomyces parasiticus]|uniref:Mannosyltransferase n=1 Tax=Tieghemiomyces parasiticus TaxID=78921 RepID=A0A9W8DRC3_9FUNG|nr:glycosylphosphatidylinositol anchor biosynthesis [Tieghemiomyces parasiticus]